MSHAAQHGLSAVRVVKAMYFNNEERVLAVSNDRKGLAKFGVIVGNDRTAQEDKTGRSSDWRDVDLSGVNWDEIWAIIAAIEGDEECGDMCTL